MLSPPPPTRSRCFRFLVETTNQNSDSESVPTDSGFESIQNGAELPFLEVPSGVSFLWLEPDGTPIVLSEAPTSGFPLGRLEPLEDQDRPELVLTTHRGSHLRINGFPAPRASKLGLKDQLQLGPETVLHMTVYHHPRISPPSPEKIGTKCPVCLTKFKETTRVLACPSCGCVVHAEGQEVEVEKRLECSTVSSECPNCSSPLNRAEGYLYHPEV